MIERVLARSSVLLAMFAISTALPAVVLAQGPRVTLDAQSSATWAALLAAHDARAQDTVAVDAAIASRIAPLRAAAARVVGLNRIQSRYAAVRELLRADRDTAVARDAAFALGLATDSTSCGALRAALPTPRAGAAAAWALAELGARCTTFDSLYATTRLPAVRAALLRGAGKWTPFPDSVVVGAWRTAHDRGERWAALYAPARGKRAAGAPLAGTAARDTSASVRELAARLLARAGDGSAADGAVALLTRLLRDQAPHVRVAAVRALATFPDGAAAALAPAWDMERDANVRVSMAQALGAVGDAGSPLWAAWWRSDTTHMVRRSLLASAWQARAIDTLQVAAGHDLYSDDDPRLRIAMIDGAATSRLLSAAPRIASLAGDADPRVRAAAVAALGAMPAEVRDTLGWDRIAAAAAEDADDAVRRALPGARASSAAAAPQPTPDYLRIVREVIAPSLSGMRPSLVLETDRGPIRISLDGVQAPMTSDHLSALARRGYFTGLRFHRVVPAFVAQGGDPRGDGNGGPGYSIRDELNRSAYVRGAVGMALAGPDTGGSQFFLTLAPQPHLDGHYTVFGRVTAGHAAMDALVQGDVLRTMTPSPK